MEDPNFHAVQADHTVVVLLYHGLSGDRSNRSVLSGLLSFGIGSCQLFYDSAGVIDFYGISVDDSHLCNSVLLRHWCRDFEFSAGLHDNDLPDICRKFCGRKDDTRLDDIVVSAAVFRVLSVSHAPFGVLYHGGGSQRLRRRF